MDCAFSNLLIQIIKDKTFQSDHYLTHTNYQKGCVMIQDYHESIESINMISTDII